MSEQEKKGSHWKRTLLISVLILVVAAIVTFIIFRTEPTAQKVSATKETAMLVDVMTVQMGDYQPEIVATGTVQAAVDIMLSPRVSGQIIDISPDFVPGGFVRKGQILARIDPADFSNELQLRQSELAQAKADLSIEQGRQDVARKDFQLMRDVMQGVDSSLVLRQPQLESIQARVQAAKAAVEQAQLSLNRSNVTAPFNAQVLSRNVNIGSQVAAGEILGRLVGVDEYWVQVNISLAQSAWLQFPEETGNRGSPVRIRNQTAWPDSVYREGYLFKRIGALEGQTRLLRILVTVPDPMGYMNEELEKPPLILGSFVEATIPAREIDNVVRLNRDFLRKDETAWVMENSKLQIRDLNIIFKDAKYAYIRKGLKEGDKVVTTNLSTVVEGSPLRTENPAPQDSLSRKSSKDNKQ